MVKVSKMTGVKKIEDDEDRREMITPALREALTKQGKEPKNLDKLHIWELWIGNRDEYISLV